MKKKTVAALALTAALAMGTAPAFAADEKVAIPDNAGSVGTDASPITQTTTKDAEGHTVVSVQTLATNITATIPLNMTVVGPAEGGPLVTPGNYNIKNSSAYAISVSVKASTENVTDKIAKTDWVIVDDIKTVNQDLKDQIDLQLTPKDGTQIKVSSAKASSAENWKIAAKGNTDTQCDIAVSGNISASTIETGTAAPALKLVYTIAPTTIPTPDTPAEG